MAPPLSETISAAIARALDAVLAAGRAAPTAWNTQPQSFVVVEDEARRAEIVARAAADRTSGTLHWPTPWFAEAPVLAAVLYDPQRCPPGATGDRQALLSLGAVLESCRLAALASGCAWTEWRPSEGAEKDLKRLLAIPPERECHAVFGLIPARPSFPPPPALSTPFAETYGHADPLLRIGPVARPEIDVLTALARRRTAGGHFVSAPLAPEAVRALVAGAARAGRASGINAARLVYVQSPSEIGKLADVMFEVSKALYADADWVKAAAQWQTADEEEWRNRGFGLLAEGKDAGKLLRSSKGGLWGKLASAFSGTDADELIEETISLLVREAPLLIAFVIDPEGRTPGRRSWAAAVIDAGSSMMRTSLEAERLGLGGMHSLPLLEKVSSGPNGEEAVKALLKVPAGCEVVAAMRVGRLDTEDSPPSIIWRGEVRLDPAKTVFKERWAG